MTPAAIITAILILFPHTPAKRCIEQRRDSIEAALAESERSFPEVPLHILAATAFVETHLGCDPGEAGGWGAPINRRERHTAGTHLHAASSLNRSYTVCRDWEGALRRFHTGLCNPRRESSSATVRERGDRYGRMVMNIARRITVVILEREESTGCSG